MGQCLASSAQPLLKPPIKPASHRTKPAMIASRMRASLLVFMLVFQVVVPILFEVIPDLHPLTAG